MKTLNSRTQKISFATRAKNSLLATTMLTAAGLVAIASPARAEYASPVDGVNVGGSSTTTQNGDTFYTEQTSKKAVTEYSKALYLGEQQSWYTNTPGKGSISVHLIKAGSGADPSALLGYIHSNGKFVVVDPNGIFFGPNSRVDVNGLVATTGNIDVADVMDGNDTFAITDVGAGGKIDLQGTVTVADAGLAAFVAPQISNSGVINARVGKVAMAAGEKVTLDLYGDNLVEIAVDDKVADALIENSGRINANGGEVIMTAQAAKDAVDNVINNTGIVDVSSVTQVGGKIILSGGKQGTVNVGGSLNANGEGGGSVSVKGQNIKVNGTVSADGGTNGNGGDVVVFADNLAVIEGTLSARGGTQSGNGGFIETSAAALGISEDALIDAYAFNGEAGLWLIDPLSIVISSAAGAIVNVGGSEYTNINSGAVSATLSGGTNVTIETGVNSAFSLFDGKFLVPDNNDGDILVRSNITHSGATSTVLTLLADGDISIENGADITATNAGSLGLVFKADGSVIGQQGDITINNGSSIFTNGGQVDFTADDDIVIGGTVDSSGNYTAWGTNGGDINLKALGTGILKEGVVQITSTGQVISTDNAGNGSTEGDITIAAENVSIDISGGTRIDAADGGSSDGLVTFTRTSSGTIGLGAASGNMQISQAEIGAVDYRDLQFGGTDTRAINVENFNTVNAFTSSLIAPALVTMIVDVNTGSDNDVNFKGTNVFDSLQVNSNDDIVFADGATVTTTAGDATFTGDDNNATVGDFLMGANSRLDTNGNNVDISVLNLTMNTGSEIDSEGGNIHILTRDDFAGDGKVNILGGHIDADGGNILIDNRDIFYSQFADSVTTHGTGTIDINQWAGGLIQNAIDAVENTGTGLNTIHVGPGTFAENVLVYEDNFRLFGNNQGIDANTGVRNPETIIDGGIGSFGTAFAVHNVGDNFTIDGFTLTADGNGVRLGGDGPVDGAFILNNLIETQNVIDSQDAGIQGYDASNVTVFGNLLNVIGNDGMNFQGGSNVGISTNVINSADYHGIYLSGVNGSTIAGNVIKTTGIFDVGHGIAVIKGTGANTVAGNLVGVGGTINGDGIHVEDTAGIVIASNSTDNVSGHGIFVDPSPNTQIINNVVNNSGLDGIHLDDSINSLILVNTVTNSGEDGIGVTKSAGTQILNNTVSKTGNAVAETGIEVVNSAGVIVSSNKVSDSFWDGIGVWDSANSSIASNEVINSGQSGYALKGSDGSTIIGNSATDSGAFGIWSRLNNGALIQTNTITKSGIDGIIQHGGSANTIDNNTISVAGLNGIRLFDALGTKNVVSNNTIDFAVNHGIHLYNSDDVKVFSNKIGSIDLGAFGSGSGDGINVSNGSDAALIDSNIIITDGRGVSLLGGNSHNVGNNTISTISWVNSNDEGVYADNTTNANIHDNKISTADNIGIHVNAGSNVTVSKNNIDAATQQGIYINTVATALVDANEIDNTGSHGIHANNTTGLTISKNLVGTTGGAGNINGDGIHVVDSAAAQITGNTVADVTGNGTFVDPSPGTTIDGNTYTNVGLDGIHLLDSINSFITNNTINTTGGDGIEVNNSGGTEVGNNIIDFAPANGIYVNNSDGVTVYSNKIGQTDLGAFGSGSGDGVLVANGSDDAVVDGNTITTDGRGVSLLGGNNHEVKNNTITTISWVNANDEGVYAESTTNANIHHNTVNTADNDGIEVNGGSSVQVDNNTVNAATEHGIYLHDVIGVNGVDNNIVHNTGFDGINAYNVTSLSVTGNVVYNTTDDGIDVSESDYAQVNGNYVGYVDTVFNAGGANNIGADGISVINSDYADVNSNYVINTTGHGIYVDPSQYVDVWYNNIQNAGIDGVHADDAYGVYVYGNYINNSGDDGVEVYNSDYAQVNYNSIYYSTDNGVKIDDSDYVDVIGNYVYSSGGNGIYVDPSSFDEVASNTIYYSGLNGILVEGGLDHWVHSNYVYGSNYDGIRVVNFRNANISFNEVDYTGDDGIEAVTGATVWIEGNDVTNAGYWANNADYYGADGIHVRNVNGPLYDGNSYSGEGNNAGNGRASFAPFGSESDYNVVIVDNNVGVLGDDEIETYVYDEEYVYEDYSVSGAKDDGIEVVGNDWAYGDYYYGSYYGTGRTLIGWNNVSNVGVGSYYGSYYGAADGYGADGIHVRGVHANEGYYGSPILSALVALEGDGDPLWGPDGFGYSVEIIENTVNNTGDDGIEVLDSGKTLIAGNEVNNTGLGFNDGGYPLDYEYLDGYYYGQNDGDGIHVRNVFGNDGVYEGYYSYDYTHSVEILNNDVSNTGDDGIEVEDSGRTLIGGNNVSNAGWNSEGYAYGDYYGADGIHVRNVYANEYYNEFDYFDNYDVQVIDNTVTHSDDDGIEVTYYGRRPALKELKVVSEEEIPYYGYLATVNVIGNDVDQSGDDGIDVTNANFVFVDNNEVTNSGGDGITVNRDGSDDYYEEMYSKEIFPIYDGYFPNNVVITDNVVDQSGDDGIEVQGYGQIEIGRNIVTNSGDDGVIVHDLLFGYPVFDEAPVEEASLFLFDPYYGEAFVNIHDNNVDQSGGDGIQVDAHNYYYWAPAGSIVHVTNNVVTNSGANGLYISGPNHGYVYVAGNTFQDNPTGANFESGLIDLTGPTNNFLNGNVGLFFNPYADYYGFAPLSLVDDDAPGYETHPSVNVPTNFGGTIGEQFFSGQSTYFVQLGNQAFWDFGVNEAIWLNGLNSTYDTPSGLVRPANTGGAVSQAVYDFLEERFWHYPDTGNTGIFWFGFVPNLFDLAQEDLFNTFGPFNPGTGGLNITLLGLPQIPGGGGPNFSPEALNAINTFACASEDGNLSPEELNAIQTAAGGNAGTGGGNNAPQGNVTCWSDATNAAVNGQPVNYSYSTDPDANIADAASCSAPPL